MPEISITKGEGLLKQRLFYLLRIYILTVLLLEAGKVAFMCYNRQGHPFAWSDVGDVLANGLSLDLSTALYVLAVPFLLTFVRIWTDRAENVLRWVLRVYYAVIALVLSLAVVADACLYPFWGFKLDASCLQYLATPAQAFASVSVGFLLCGVFILILLVVGIYFLYTRVRYTVGHTRFQKGRAIGETLLYVVLIPLMVIGIRGGLGESTTNIGQVYYSQNQFLNHSAVNPVFSFLSSFEKSANHIVDYDFFDGEECDRLMEGLYPTVSERVDTLLTTERPNIVLILLESSGSMFTKEGGREEVMPRLSRLMDEGVYFENCYANSYRTDRGTVCTMSGYPSFPTSSVMKMPKKTRHLPGIANTLRSVGYNTAYLYGGDINFTNMRSYLVTIGYEDLHWMTHYTMEEQHSANWGVRDDITFGTLYEMMEEAAKEGKPYLIGYSTLSSHEPWDVPTKVLDDEILNAFHYLDRCIGDFIDRLKASPMWDNTLVIMLPDHSINYGGIGQENPQRNRIPLVWTGGAVREPRRIPQLCNQTDLAATLLGQLGIPHDQYTYSRDVLGSNYHYPFAVHNYNHGFSIVDSTGFMVHDLNAGRTIVDQTTDEVRLERMGKAILQATTHNLKTMN